eukprot:173953_1
MEESKADTDGTKDRVGAEEYCENIQNCRHLKQLYKKMIEYNDYNTSNHKHGVHNTINMVEFIDDYLHLIYQHDNDEDFEFIVCELDGHNCDIMNCKMHRRNYRNRSNDKDDDHQHMDVNEAVYVDIMDTAHCYFVHCYDVGKRLTRSEKQLTHCVNDEKHDTLNTFEQQLTSKELVKIKSILQEKQDTFETLNGEVINTKFNQISDACTHTNGKFSFGNQFFYGYEGEFQDPDAMIEVHPIYHSLKDELVSNKLSVVTINHFINQCKKAQWMNIIKTIAETVDEYHQKFIKANVIISANLYNNQLNIVAVTNDSFEYSSVGCVLNHFGQRYFCNLNSETIVTISKLINAKLTNRQIESTQLDEYCSNKHVLEIDWRDVERNTKLGIFEKLYCLEYQWIKLHVFQALFPNTDSIYIKHIRL